MRFSRPPHTLGAVGAALFALVVVGAALVVLQGRGGVPMLPQRCPAHICAACPAAADGAADGAAAAAEGGGEVGAPAACPPPPECLACPKQPEQQVQPPPQQCPECPACPNSSGGAAAGRQAPQQQQQQQQPPGAGSRAQDPDAAGADNMPLLCGGAAAVPPVAEALGAARAALAAGLQQSFARYEGGFTLEDLMQTADNLGIDGTHDTKLWVEVRNGTMVFPRRAGRECRWFCNNVLPPWKAAFEAGIAQGKLRVPEGLPMLWNVHDESGCATPEACPGPLLSVIRHRGHADVAVPGFAATAWPFEPHFVPWDEKSDLAFFRGKPWCAAHGLNGSEPGPTANCSREALPLLSLEHPDLLNVSIQVPYGRAPAREGPPVPHADFARFKYLLNLDGISASYRLATLLAINSLVLKQASPWAEWYHAALRPCVHYLPFWVEGEADLLLLLRALRSPANQAVAQRLAAHGWAFAAAHLSQDAVYAYWQGVLDRYVQLYRGPANATRAAEALAWAEAVGQKASAHGAEVEAQCWAERGAMCWYVGRDAAKEVVSAARREREAAAGSGGGARGVG